MNTIDKTPARRGLRSNAVMEASVWRRPRAVVLPPGAAQASRMRATGRSHRKSMSACELASCTMPAPLRSQGKGKAAPGSKRQQPSTAASGLNPSGASRSA